VRELANAKIGRELNVCNFIVAEDGLSVVKSQKVIWAAMAIATAPIFWLAA
jgi:hypothetical protein